MADLIVSPLLHPVKQLVVDCLKYQYELRSGVEGKLKNLEATLNRIEAVANTADELDLEKHMDLKAWARELKVAAEEAIDVLDKFKYLCLQRQAEQKLLEKVERFFLSTNPLEKLKSIQIKLDTLARNGEQFLLAVIAHQNTTNQEHHKQDGRKQLQETSSSVVERQLVGRKDNLKEIINKLLLEEEPVSDGGTFTVPVLPVVGHGGMGKTTLAQHVFNDTSVAKHFPVRMWAYVSQDFHVPTLTWKMIKSAAPGEKCSVTEPLEALQQKLKYALKSKRFLLVLDDMWYDNQKKFDMEEKWKILCSPLAEAGGKGSKILLTSRTPEVKHFPGALTPINLEGLEQNDCWSIIQRTAFRGSEIPDGYGDLVKLGEKIDLRVCGSPLAAKAVGGILRNELSLTYWSNILNTELSKLPGNDVMAVLRLSYRHLSPHLRQCFDYCSLFPKGHHFDVDMLVRMWVAHDYIQSRANGEETEEDIGRNYFNDLLSAGFFTRQFNEDAVMHDLMHQLAEFVSKGCLFIEHTLPPDGSIPEAVRHLSVRTDYLAELSKEGCNLNNLRTLLLFDNGNRYDELDEKLVKQVLLKLQSVRVLDVHGCNLKVLPKDISGWKHLRYLDLSCTNIARLPDSISKLYHLQVLDIRLTSTSSVKLNKLVNLRFLGPDQHVKMFWLRELKFIQVLRGTIFVEKGDVSEMGILKDLNELGETLVLDNLNQVVSGAAAREADLDKKKKLQRLHLEWQFFPGKSALAVEVLEGLQPPSTLERLEIYNYAGTVCPNWMSNPDPPYLANLVSIYLKNLTELECLPPLGLLPFLRSVELKYLPRVKKLSQEGFPSLETLMIEDMTELEEWTGPVAIRGFPCLEKLCITKCPNMRGFPTLSSDHQEVGSSSNVVLQASASLKKLKIEKCPAMLVEASSISTVDDGEWMAREPFSLAVESLEIDDPQMLIKVPVLKSLTSVRKLKITDASGLISFSPELKAWLLQNGTSLRTLNVENALMLRSLPNLPNSLEELNIRKTRPEFMKKYERVTGPAWHKIGNIKHVDIS